MVVCQGKSGQWLVDSGQKGAANSGQWLVDSGQKDAANSGQWLVDSGQKDAGYYNNFVQYIEF